MSNSLPTPSLLELDGKSYRVTPVTLSDQLEIASFFRDEYMKAVNRQLVGLPKEIASTIWTEEKQKADAIEVGTDAYKDRLLKLDGLTYALYLAIRREASTFKLADSRKAFDEDNDAMITKALAALGYERKNPTGADNPPQP